MDELRLLFAIGGCVALGMAFGPFVGIGIFLLLCVYG
jgi:hypothetical protein